MKIKYQFTDNKYGYIYTTIARNKYEARLNILRKMRAYGYYVTVLLAEIREVCLYDIYMTKRKKYPYPRQRN